MPLRAPQLRSTVRRLGWVLVALLGMVAVLGYYLLPPDSLRTGYDLLGVAAAVAVGVGVWVHRPSPVRPWLLLGAGIATYVLGDLLYSTVVPQDHPFPSVADAAYLLGMVLLIGGASRIDAAPRGKGLDPNLLDAWLLATAIGVVLWLVVIDPLVAGTDDLSAALVTAAYPVLDLVAIAVVAHGILSGARRRPASALLAAGLAAFAAADLVYTTITLSGVYAYGGPVDAGWLSGYVLFAAAALHPSVGRPAVVQPSTAVGLGRGRRVLLVGALVVAVLALGEMPLRGPDDILAALVGAVMIVVLVVARLFGALNENERRMLESDRLRRELRLQGRRDPLTGLPNRHAFSEALETLLADRGAWLLFLDLDGFKPVNDGFGHAVGDRLLRTISERLEAAAPEGATVGRLGGDEFCMAIDGTLEEDAVRSVAHALIDRIEQPVELDAATVRVSASVGIAAGPPHAVAAEVLRSADVAMYEAKARGGGTVVGYRADRHQQVMRGYRIASDILRGLERDEFLLEFQPIVELRTRRPVALEALLRWHHPEVGRLGPSDFIGLAERSAMIERLDDRALDLAAAHLQSWRASGMAPVDLAVHVNLSAHRLDLARIRSVLGRVRAHGLPPGAFVFEVTEGSLLDREPARVALAALRAAGARVALDDFGVRYAVLSELTDLPFDLVKLDRSFLEGIEEERRQRLLRGTLTLLRDLGMTTVVEGVEAPHEAELLLAGGAQLVQGYLFGRPIPAGSVRRLLRDLEALPAGGLLGDPARAR